MLSLDFSNNLELRFLNKNAIIIQKEWRAYLDRRYFRHILDVFIYNIIIIILTFYI